MKKLNIPRKSGLTLSKETISNLHARELNQHVGGVKSKNCNNSNLTCGAYPSCKHGCTANCSG